MHNGYSTCPVCGNTAELSFNNNGTSNCKCELCGYFKITEEASEALRYKKYCNERAKISSYLRYRDIRNLQVTTIFLSKDESKKSEIFITIDEIIDTFSKNIEDRIDNAIENLSLLSKYAGDYISIKEKSNSLLYCDNDSKVAALFMLRQLCDLGYLESLSGNILLDNEFRLTVKGWSRVAELQDSNSDSKDAFIAMSFNSALKDIYDNAIKKAIEDAGYNPIRVDAKEYNSKICDEIIANIRKAKFIVADATEQKNGVYFEAGFAMGLGKPVIWMCREDDINNLHFDTRQYNHIVWKDENGLREALLRRIQATIY